MRPSVSDLQLPPPYSLVPLREAGDAFAHACAIAADEGAGTLAWVRRYDLAEFAVVLEPDDPLEDARRAIYAGMNALADALAVHAPPSRPITFDWPDTVRVDGVLVGGARLGWPEGARENEIPDWLVFSGMIRTAVIRAGEPGLRPLLGALDELGFVALDAGEIVASFSRHLMAAFHEWSDTGFGSIASRWLDRLPRKGDEHTELAGNGDLVISHTASHGLRERKSLSEALARPSWLDPMTGTPWL
ncbi:biotin/lipoate--protein ligase family protein [Mesorhizobium ventifaucium]|uniref:BPL/LPL catalytic domain-containing protein n=1 Tax=Mesorhizobium ventifaucium TaxID=666020 RepID=A0ABN8JT81_9HYPH|nr:biotin/lipoate--protein ligase family protein [Mesorhizobium ventifaucium]CAH2400738.1 BPL/LPL catalytic domain-containing protein [Mesorhizobium ventifaucium]